MKFILITGVSSGIGLYLLELLAAEGYSVIGACRNPDILPAEILIQKNIHFVRLDVCEDQSVAEAFQIIEKITAGHGLFALFNNAGIAIPGPVTHLSIDKFKYQFEVNVFGTLRMIQYAFPLLQKCSEVPRIINISSVSGLFAAPFLGAYAGSKFALEGISDSLRRELNMLNMKVILIEPGPVKTPIWKKNLKATREFASGPYSLYLNSTEEIILETERQAMDLQRLKKPVLHALNSKKPRARYLIHKNKYLFYLIAKFLPVPLTDFLIKRNLLSRKRKLRPI